MATISNDPVFHWRSSIFLCHFADHEESMIFYFDPKTRPNKTFKMSILKRGGFIIGDPSEDPYTIVLSSKNADVTSTSTSAKLQNFDYFDAKFIEDSVKANKLQNLNEYRIGNSIFCPNANANDILLRRKKWSDIAKLSPRMIRMKRTNASEPNPVHKSPEKAKVKPVGASHVDTGNGPRKGSLARKLAERSAGPLMTSTPLVTSRMSSSPKRGADRLPTTVRESSENERGPPPQLPSTSRTSTWVRAVVESSQPGTKVTRVQNSPPGRPATPVSPMSSLSEDDNFSFASKDSKRKRTRRDYNEHERKEILKYIITYDFYMFTGGMKMWTYLEKLQIVPGHTDQSLKEHFRKKILPNLHTFKLPPDVLKKFKTAKAGHKKHAFEAPIDLKNMKILK